MKSKCYFCQKHKDISQFYPNPSRHHGVAAVCRKCHSDEMRLRMYRKSGAVQLVAKIKRHKELEELMNRALKAIKQEAF